MAADRCALVLGPQRLRGVLDQREPVPLAQRPQLVELAGIAEHVDRADALGDELLEVVDRRPERQPSRAQHLEDEFLLPLAHPRASERYLFSSRRSWLASLPSGAKGQTSYPENAPAFFGFKLLRACARRTRATAPSARCGRARCRGRPPAAPASRSRRRARRRRPRAAASPRRRCRT